MKRFLCIAVFLLLFLACGVSARAADNYVVLDGFAFDLNTSGEAVIHAYDNRESDVLIPDELLGAKVVRIDDYAFYQDTVITSVCFDQATRLDEIGDSAFAGCSSLTELTLPAGAILGFGAFQNCTGLTGLTIPEGIAEIPEQCFYRCSALTEAVIPASVTSIGTRAFGGCDSLRMVEIPDTVTHIAPNAFDGDEALTIRCAKGSYAEQYAKENGIPVFCPDGTLLRGDADGDGIVTILDATNIQRYLAQYPVSNPEITVKCGNINGDGLDIMDATRIQRFLAQYPDPYGIGELII